MRSSWRLNRECRARRSVRRARLASVKKAAHGLVMHTREWQSPQYSPSMNFFFYSANIRSDAQAELCSSTNAAVAPPTARLLELSFPYSFETYSHSAFELSEPAAISPVRRLSLPFSLAPPIFQRSTLCSGINLGGCPFDSRHERDRPEERDALPESHDPQVVDLSSQAPAYSLNERSTYAASSNEFVVLCQRDLPRRKPSSRESRQRQPTFLSSPGECVCLLHVSTCSSRIGPTSTADQDHRCCTDSICVVCALAHRPLRPIDAPVHNSEIEKLIIILVIINL
ncbi:unnamed protein product [Trichogramma brassicae]|uniref:Uncharacterized protein n=1 Tax=Trichogramma brassicae TaxID=86971 RepID=A0A6H5IU75_9HYME|nr:unnamed protein product [Trichogramma brassicae]